MKMLVGGVTDDKSSEKNQLIHFCLRHLNFHSDVIGMVKQFN